MKIQHEYSDEQNLIRLQMEHGRVLIHLEPLGKSFGKVPQDFLNLNSTREFIIYLEKGNRTGFPILETKKKCKNPGIWAQRDLAYEYAHWLNPAFGICLRRCTWNFLETSMRQVNRETWPIPSAEPLLTEILWEAVRRTQISDCDSELLKALDKAAFENHYKGSQGETPSLYPTIDIDDTVGLNLCMLDEILRKNGIIYECGGTWILSKKYQGMNYAVTKMDVSTTKRGEFDAINAKIETFWTDEGFDFVVDMLSQDLRANIPSRS